MNSKQNAPKLPMLLILLVASIWAQACGLKGGSPNQGTPSGTPISQGTLSPFPCNNTSAPSATGVVTVYDQGGGSYAVNISGISYSGTCTGSLIVGIFAGSTYYSGSSITIFSGTQNFYFSASSAPQQVYLHCQLGQPAPNNDCAVATLTGI